MRGKLFMFLLASSASAAVWDTNGTQADFAAKYAASAAGDTIRFPAGSWTWTSKLYNSASGVYVTNRIIEGAGRTSTVIVDQVGGANGHGLFYVGPGVTFRSLTLRQATTGYSENLIVGYAAHGLIVTDCLLDDIVRRGVHTYTNTTGLVYNSKFVARSYPGSPSGGTFQLVTVEGHDDTNNSNPPNQASTVGSWQFAPDFSSYLGKLVIEDTEFEQDAQGDASIETYNGANVVVRRFTGTNFFLGIHGRDSSTRSGHTIDLSYGTISINLGTSYPGLINSRGGTGVVHNMTLTQSNTNGSQTSGNKLLLQVYRARVNDYTTVEFNGTHTGSSGAATLTDDSKSYTTNQFVPAAWQGGATGDMGQFLHNTTTGAIGRITANTGTTVTATLVGGSRQTWEPGDAYTIITRKFPYYGGQGDGHSPYDGNSIVFSGTHTGSNGATVLTDSGQNWGANELDGYGNYTLTNTLRPLVLWNRTTGAWGYVESNTATTATARLWNGTRQDWNTGDQYVLTYGYPLLDQNGRSGPTTFAGTYSTQALNPWYSWNNSFNGSSGQLPFALDYMSASYTNVGQPDSSVFVQENREYYNNTAKPAYQSIPYPHPWRQLSAPSARPAAALGAGVN